MENTVNTMYHYCKLDTFVKIIESGKLRFADITKSNDRDEVLFLLRHFIEFAKREFEDIHLTQSTEFLINQTLSQYLYLAACFSEKYDSNYMWSCYANDGVAIGFDVGKMKDWISKFSIGNGSIFRSTHSENGIAKLRKVKYYSEETVFDGIKTIEESCKNDMTIVNLLNQLFLETIFSKSNYWEEETEWRVCVPYSRPCNYIFDSGLKMPIFPPRVSLLQNVPSEEFPLRYCCDISFEKEMISEIVLSPYCKATCNDIQLLLQLNGYSHLSISADNIQLSKGNFQYNFLKEIHI